MRRTLGRNSVIGLLIAGAGALMGITPVVAAPVEYDYTGSNFTNFFCTCGSSGAYTTGDKVTGDIVLNTPLAPSSVTFLTSPSQFSSFSFSDGVDTITNATVASSTATGLEFGGTITTNAADQIISGNLTFQAGTTGVGAFSETIATTPTGSFGNNTIPGKNGQGTSFTPGTWSGPVTVSPPGPSLYLNVNTMGPTSLSGDPANITASVMLATTPPPGDWVPISLPKMLSPDDHTLQDVAHDLGYLGFDWEQTIGGPSPLPLYACKDIDCTETEEVKGSIPDPSATFGLGLDYCNPHSPNFVGKDNFPGGSCVHPDYYDPLIAEDPTQSAATCVKFTKAGCINDLTEADDTIANFFDAPRDPCLLNEKASDTPTTPPITKSGPSLAFLKNVPTDSSAGPTTRDVCQGLTTAGRYSAVTTLVGLTGTSEIDLATFNWTDSYNGYANELGTGGISWVMADTGLEADGTTGTGGIVITQINGIAMSSVPEPSTMGLLFVALILLVCYYKIAQCRTISSHK
jgi:hypothetical protein